MKRDIRNTTECSNCVSTACLVTVLVRAVTTPQHCLGLCLQECVTMPALAWLTNLSLACLQWPVLDAFVEQVQMCLWNVKVIEDATGVLCHLPTPDTSPGCSILVLASGADCTQLGMR